MYVEMGNAAPHEYRGDSPEPFPLTGPAVYRISIPDSYTMEPADASELALHVVQRPGMLTPGVAAVSHLPDQEAFVAVVSDWPHHSAQGPSWVESDHEELERVLAAFYGCDVGKPDDVEDTHVTQHAGRAYPAGQAPEES